MTSTTDAPTARRIAIVGAGAIGAYLADRFSARGHRVAVYARRPGSRLVLTRAGVARELPVDVRVTHPEGEPAPDHVLVATKAHDTRSVEPLLRVLRPRGGSVVVVQNGVDSQASLDAAGLDLVVVPALLYANVERVDDASFIHRAGDLLILPGGEEAGRIAATLAGGALQVQTATDFRRDAWEKLLTNIAVNPLTALTGKRMAILQDPAVLALARAVMHEGARVARAEGVAITDERVEELVSTFTDYPPDGGTSMLFDFRAARVPEHDALTGTIVRGGMRHGIPTPVATVLHTLVATAAAPTVVPDGSGSPGT